MREIPAPYAAADTPLPPAKQPTWPDAQAVQAHACVSPDPRSSRGSSQTARQKAPPAASTRESAAIGQCAATTASIRPQAHGKPGFLKFTGNEKSSRQPGHLDDQLVINCASRIFRNCRE